mmetsp:Transcript_27955/g.31405  ORF Transcript_27955/g.31405 Transcript_27955/m.31405 type:complete len:811 (-) Transcript_27955:257-2689(-)
MAAASATDHKNNVKSNPTAPYTSAQYKKLGVGEAAARAKQQGVGPAAPPGPPAMYPPPPPGVPPHHHHAYHAWAAYRYAQQHPQYHAGRALPPPPPPPGHHGWNAEAYAASHQAYVAVSKTAATAKGTKVSEHGSPAKGTRVVAPPVVAGSLPHQHSPHHNYPHSGSPSAGPYRYSDPTLRRDALSRLSTPDSKNNGTAPTSMSPNALSGSPPTPVSTKSGGAGGGTNNHSPSDPATLQSLHMLELEARAEGATSPSQIEDFHREEVTTMGCTCKKTKCLKLYCQCFAVKIYCGNNCRCLACSNNPLHESERQDAIRGILSRNPSAFDTKFQKLQRNSANMSKSSSNGAVSVSADRLVRRGKNDTAVSGGVEGRGLFTDIPHARTISHKLGCKCRKSACMKKYCECYAGNVKCSSNCRCVGCKNMPVGAEFGKGDAPPTAGNTTANIHNSRTPTKSSSVMTTPPSKKEPSWMMDAAQNLAFLRHGSAEKPKRIISRGPSEAGSMPSLTSSSEESPIVGADSGNLTHTKNLPVNGTRSILTPSTAERAAVNALQSSEKTAVNALLMAAMAMTEMSGQEHTNNRSNNENAHDASASTTNNTDISAKDTVTSAATSSPLLDNHRNNIDQYGNENNNCSPEATIRTDDQFETPQRNLLKKFISPKRKANEIKIQNEMPLTKNKSDHTKSKSSSFRMTSLDDSIDNEDGDDDDDESPKRDREHLVDGIPSIHQKIKRSRLGSLKKGARLVEGGNSSDLEATNGVVPMVMSTPAKHTNSKITDLTPVSARCIDFKKMRVNDSNSDPAVVDTASTGY